MAMNRLKIQKFRTNDLVDDGGKQFEVGRSWCDDFFLIPQEVEKANISLTFKPLCSKHKDLEGTKIDLLLSNVNTRGDRKAYASEGNCSAIKDFFLHKLHLSIDENLSDYFAVYKADKGDYFLFYVPKLLYDNFIDRKSVV